MRLILSFYMAAMASAVSNIHPHPTMDLGNAIVGHGWSPRPTEGPSMEVLGERLNYFEERQAASLSSNQLVGFFAQDSMCGYISGSIGASLPCSTSSRCAAIAPIGNSPGAVGCCPLGGRTPGCYFITTCYNLAEVQSSKCDQGCLQDADVRVCTASTAPYCFGYTWADISATIWGCAASSVSTKAPVSLNFLGATSTKTWSAYYYTPSASGASSNELVSAASSLRSATGAAQSASNSPSPTPAAKSSTNVGAIVGGVVGGLAVLGALAFGIVFLLLRKRKSKKNADAAAAAGTGPNTGAYPTDPNQPQMGQQGHMSMAPAGAAAGYYGQPENKQTISELGSPAQSPGASYLQPGMKDPNTPYHDNRVSAYSESGSPVPPYQQPYQQQMPPIQQAPMELDGTSSHHVGPQGQPLYEAPAGVPGHRP